MKIPSHSPLGVAQVSNLLCCRLPVGSPPEMPRISESPGACGWKIRDTAGSKPALRNRGGFSLVEVLCAVLILGVALVGLTQGISTALQSNKDSELQTTAALFAAGLIETVRAESWIVDETTEGTCGPGLSQYEWTQSIAPAGIEGLHEVAVVVRHATSRKTICELKTLLFEMPLSSTAPESRSDSSNRRNRTRR